MTRPLPWHHPRRWGSAALVWALMAQMVVPAHAYVSQLPGAFTAPPDPNVMFTLDDSRSMWSDVIPDLRSERDSLAGIPGNDSERQFPEMWKKDSPFLDAAYFQNSTATSANQVGRYLRSASTNPIYYDPKIQYRPWPREPDQVNPSETLPPANRAAVNIDRTDPTRSTSTIDLTTQMGNPPFWPATYFIQTSTAAVPSAQPNSPASRNATFEMVEIRPSVTIYPKRHVSPEIDKRTDCAAATSCTYDEELQNFANWLQYYRSRTLMAKGAVALAFSRQGNNLRVGFGTINNTVQLGVRTFDETNRRAFYEQLYQSPANGATPLRRAMTEVGEYFRREGVGNPWAEFPETNSIGKEQSCRRSFHILSTDGFWNSDSVSVGNADNFANEETPRNIDGKRFPYSNAADSRFAISPFADTYDNTLADVAAYYWKTDLRDGLTPLTNNVIPSSRDPAYWQHLTTYTVGLGITGTGGVTRGGEATVPTGLPANHPLRPFEGEPWLKSQGARDWLVANKVPLNWTEPGSNLATTGDDLIHAALNGHGRYLIATNPNELANNLSSALAEAVDNPGDLATLAVDSAQVLSDGNLYQAIFSPSRWYGRLYAFKQDPTTGVVDNTPIDALTDNPSQVWEASNKMPAPERRNIFTSRGGRGSGTPFTWDRLSAQQRGHLGEQRVLDYLRGDPTYEVSNDGPFRDRTRYTVNGVRGGVLGDVIGGSPLKGPAAGGGYDRLPNTATSGQSTYATFRSATGPLADMLDTMFLGANDGMLHAFKLANGVERFAYVPSTVYNVPRSTPGRDPEQKLRMLSNPDYTHRFTVDGPPNVADAYFDGSWHSLLVGSTGAGARGLFVMDVTKPDADSGDFDDRKILWELTESDSADMGFVMAYPHVVRMRNNQWAVISGNGYDSASGRAVLYIRDAETGATIRDFAVGTVGDNGLSQPNFVLNANREVTAIYAGDLKGNLWKFDVSGVDATTWQPAFGANSPFFKAVGPTGLAQPITVMPEISAHPQGGAMLIFGTGKLFEPSDTSTDTGNTSTANVNLKGRQSLYGIWDAPSATAGVVIDSTTRTTLLKPQDYVAPRAGDSETFKRTSGGAPDWTTQRGWVLDLAADGERSNLPPQQFRYVVFMAANTPATADPCASSGSSKIFALDPITGAAPSFPVFDTNRNRLFDEADRGLNVLLNSSALLTQPVFQVFSSGTVVTQSGPTVQPIGALDRGQATSARGGGVELSRSNGTKAAPTASGGSGEPECKGLMSAAQSNTNLLQQLINGCPTKARISWRQLK